MSARTADELNANLYAKFISVIEKLFSLCALIPIRRFLLAIVMMQLLEFAGTTVFANLYSTYHDEEVYPDSHSFIPDRFLDDQGVFVRPTGKQVLPFSIGKRACLGESLARTELFMILVSFVQRFVVTRVGEEKVREDGIDVFTHYPRPFEYYLKQRA